MYFLTHGWFASVSASICHCGHSFLVCVQQTCTGAFQARNMHALRHIFASRFLITPGAIFIDNAAKQHFACRAFVDIMVPRSCAHTYHTHTLAHCAACANIPAALARTRWACFRHQRFGWFASCTKFATELLDRTSAGKRTCAPNICRSATDVRSPRLTHPRLPTPRTTPCWPICYTCHAPIYSLSFITEDRSVPRTVITSAPHPTPTHRT